MAKYSEKLRDPRWQKRRLQIMERDDWMCQKCCDNESMLAVHHRWYTHGKEPWDYPDECLVTLCECCHTDEGEARADYEAALLDAMRKAGFFAGDVLDIAAGFAAMPWLHFSEVRARALKMAFEDPDIIRTLIDIYFARLADAREAREAQQKALPPPQ